MPSRVQPLTCVVRSSLRFLLLIAGFPARPVSTPPCPWPVRPARSASWARAAPARLLPVTHPASTALLASLETTASSHRVPLRRQAPSLPAARATRKRCPACMEEPAWQALATVPPAMWDLFARVVPMPIPHPAAPAPTAPQRPAAAAASMAHARRMGGARARLPVSRGGCARSATM